MIGSEASIFALFPLFGLLLLVTLFVIAVRRRERWPAHKWVSIAFVSLVGSFYLIVSVAFHVSDYHRIRSLRAGDLSEIRIGDNLITSPQDIESICSALQTTDWFESQHGGWGKEFPLVLKTAAGHEYSYRIAYYKVHSGVVILRRIGGDQTYILGDVGFSSKLLEVLSRIGIHLS